MVPVRRGGTVKVLSKVLAGAFAVLAVVFALANRETVTVALSPLPVAVELPLYLLVLLVLLAGMAVGGASGWLDDLEHARPPAEPRDAVSPVPRGRA